MEKKSPAKEKHKGEPEEDHPLPPCGEEPESTPLPNQEDEPAPTTKGPGGPPDTEDGGHG